MLQNADVDGDGQDELLARGPGGIIANRFDPDTGQWLTLAGAAPDWGDAGGFDQPQYYSTIQTADLDGDGAAELLARDGAGLQAWKFTGIWNPLPRGPGWSDADSWDQPQYYETIQCSDIDGDGAAELLARDFGGIIAWKFDTISQSWRLLPRGPDWGDAGGWNKVQYYSTIQTARVNGSTGNPNNPPTPDGKPVAAVLGRSALSIATWRFAGAAQSWSRTSAPFPPFTGDQLTAYDYLTTFWGIDTLGGVRYRYNDESGVIGQWRSDLRNNLVPAPPGIAAADWQVVHDQILKELTWVGDIQTWYGTLISGLITDVYLSQDLTVQTVGDYLNLPSNDDSTVALNVLALLFNGAWAVLGFPGLEAGTLSAIAGILATLFSAAAASLPSGGSIQEAYAALQSTLASGFSAAKAANGQVQQAITGGVVDGAYLPGDYGLLAAIGQQIQSTAWNWPSTTDDLVAAVQRSYALSVWQALAPLQWHIGYALIAGPNPDYPSQYLYSTGSAPKDLFWMSTSYLDKSSYPATASLSAFFDARQSGQVFPLGVPLSDVFEGNNGWPLLPRHDFDGNGPSPPTRRPPLPTLGSDLRVSAVLWRESATGAIIRGHDHQQGPDAGDQRRDRAGAVA